MFGRYINHLTRKELQLLMDKRVHELVHVAIVRCCSGGTGYQCFDNQIPLMAKVLDLFRLLNLDIS